MSSDAAPAAAAAGLTSVGADAGASTTHVFATEDAAAAAVKVPLFLWTGEHATPLSVAPRITMPFSSLSSRRDLFSELQQKLHLSAPPSHREFVTLVCAVTRAATATKHRRVNSAASATSTPASASASASARSLSSSTSASTSSMRASTAQSPSLPQSNATPTASPSIASPSTTTASPATTTTTATATETATATPTTPATPSDDAALRASNDENVEVLGELSEFCRPQEWFPQLLLRLAVERKRRRKLLSCRARRSVDAIAGGYGNGSDGSGNGTNSDGNDGTGSGNGDADDDVEVIGEVVAPPGSEVCCR